MSNDAPGASLRLVQLALLPGIAAASYCFGFGVLLNIAWATAGVLLAEAAALRLRGREARDALRDGGAIITALLIGVSVPPASPWWLLGCASAFAIMVARHIYGGAGRNPFNPAMAGYAFVLVCFPLQMSSWSAPTSAFAVLSPLAALQASLGMLDAPLMDGFSMATPLDLMRHNRTLLVSELWRAYPQFGAWGGRGWEWVNTGFLAGGLFLLAQRVYSWHAPGALLVSLALCAALGYDAGSSASGGPVLFHLFSGATMLAAFFLITEPASAPTSTRGRLLYAALAGILIYLIRRGGYYPDGVAFAILLANSAAPLIDRLTIGRAHNER